jgi:hypothetical protein
LHVRADTLSVLDEVVRILRDHVDDPEERVGAVHRRRRAVDDLDAIDVGEWKLMRDVGGAGVEVVLLDAVDQEQRAVRGVGAVAALVDVGVAVAVAPRDVEPGQIAAPPRSR